MVVPTRMSPYFSYKEFVRSTTATRLGLRNVPDEREIQRGILVAEKVLEPVRGFYGIPFSPSSWFRSFDLERHICAKAIERWLYRHPNLTELDYLQRKQHPTGAAVDFEVPGVSNHDVAVFIQANLPFDQLILEFYTPGEANSGWVHCSYLGEDVNRGEALTYDGDTYHKGLIA